MPQIKTLETPQQVDDFLALLSDCLKLKIALGQKITIENTAPEYEGILNDAGLKPGKITFYI